MSHRSKNIMARSTSTLLFQIRIFVPLTTKLVKQNRDLQIWIYGGP